MLSAEFLNEKTSFVLVSDGCLRKSQLRRILQKDIGDILNHVW